MDVRTFLKTATKAEQEAVAHRAGTSVAYLRQLAGGWRNPSKVLAERLEKASEGRINAMAALFPERLGARNSEKQTAA